jgi:hypothetical protein
MTQLTQSLDDWQGEILVGIEARHQAASLARIWASISLR